MVASHTHLKNVLCDKISTKNIESRRTLANVAQIINLSKPIIKINVC